MKLIEPDDAISSKRRRAVRAQIYNPRILSGEEIEDNARHLFRVWVTESELEWAQQALLILDEEKLTAYDNALGLATVQIRLLPWPFSIGIIVSSRTKNVGKKQISGCGPPRMQG